MATATMEPVTQMNVRLSADLKARGDASLKAWGMTPSEYVRRMWEYAATHRNPPAGLVDADASSEKTQTLAGRKRELDAMLASRKLGSAFSGVADEDILFEELVGKLGNYA